MSIGLVLEGGGLRAVYTMGVLDVFMQEGIDIPYVAAVSAGACSATSYLAGQPERSFRVQVDYARDKRYLSINNLINKKSAFDFDFVFNKVGRELDPLDLESMLASQSIFYTGATNLVTAQPVYFGKEHYEKSFDCLRASSSQPFVSPIVKYQGMKLLDGGLSDPIPIEKSISDGNDKNIIILTRHRGYIKSKEFSKSMCYAFYGKYPHFVKLLLTRHEMYNQKLAYCEKLEREGKAVLIRPETKLGLTRMEKNPERMKVAYSIGKRDAMSKVELIKQWMMEEK